MIKTTDHSNKLSLLGIALLVSLFIFGYAFPLAAQVGNKEPDLLYPPIRIKSMGGAFVALADDDNAMYYNPAGLACITDSYAIPELIDTWHLQFAEFGVRFPASVFDTAIKALDLVSSMSKTSSSTSTTTTTESTGGIPVTQFQENIDKINQLLNSRLGLGINGPLNHGFVGRIAFLHFGLKIFNYGDMFMRTQQIGFLPSAEILITSDKGFLVGFGHSFTLDRTKKQTIQAGINFKFFDRMMIPFTHLYTSELLASDELLQRNPILQGFGFGADIGLIYQFHENMKVGLAINDIFGSLIHYKYIKDPSKNPLFALEFAYGNDYNRAIRPTVNVGYLFFLPSFAGIPSNFISDLYAMFDVRDLLYTGGQSNFMNRVHIGVEIAFLGGIMRRWIGTPIKVRMGFNQGYFTCGTGFTLLYVMNIDFGYWVDELGYAPGQIPNRNLGLTFKFAL